MLDGDGVHGAVFLPLGVDAARVPATGLCDLGGEPVGVPGDAAEEQTKEDSETREERCTKKRGPAALRAHLQGGGAQIDESGIPCGSCWVLNFLSLRSLATAMTPSGP